MLEGLFQKKPIGTQVIGKSKGAEYRFLMGFLHRNGQLDVFENSVSFKHKSGLIFLFKTIQELEEYLIKKTENEAYVKQQRAKAFGEVHIVNRLPYPRLIQASVYAVADPNPQKINNLIESKRNELSENVEALQDKPVFVAFNSAGARLNDYIPVLEVNYKT